MNLITVLLSPPSEEQQRKHNACTQRRCEVLCTRPVPLQPKEGQAGEVTLESDKGSAWEHVPAGLWLSVARFWKTIFLSFFWISPNVELRFISISQTALEKRIRISGTNFKQWPELCVADFFFDINLIWFQFLMKTELKKTCCRNFDN